MNNVRFKHCKSILGNKVFYKKKAVQLLVNFFNCNEDDLFYLFQKGKFPQKGKIKEDVFFFFHGLGCTVKNEEEGWSSSLEFGPKGKTLSFDKGTLCYILSVHMDKCDEFIESLLQQNIIKIADKELYDFIQKNPNFREWSSEEEEIDAIVADRFVYIEEPLEIEAYIEEGF